MGLAQIIKEGGSITFARQFQKWPGIANVEVSLLAIARSASTIEPSLDGCAVEHISSRLDAELEMEPQGLPQNAGESFQGSIVLGSGFGLASEEAARLIAREPRSFEVISPFLNGEDINSRSDQSPSRWVINFHDWPMERAKEHADCWQIVEEKVRPERQRRDENGQYVLRRPLPQRYWQYADKRPGLYAAIAGMERVLVRAATSEMHMMAFEPTGIVYSHAVYVFAYDDDFHFALLQSNAHEA